MLYSDSFPLAIAKQLGECISCNNSGNRDVHFNSAQGTREREVGQDVFRDNEHHSEILGSDFQSPQYLREAVDRPRVRAAGGHLEAHGWGQHRVDDRKVADSRQALFSEIRRRVSFRSAVWSGGWSIFHR